MEEVIWGIVGVSVGLAIFASIRIERERPENNLQRIGQWTFTWLVPIIGPLVTIQLLRREPERSDGEFSPEPTVPDTWVDEAPREFNIADHVDGHH